MAQESTSSEPQLAFRRAAPDDLGAVYLLFQQSVTDLIWRMGLRDGLRTPTPEEIEEDRPTWQPLFEYFSATADQFWLAEVDGKIVGYARSVLHDGVRELTEFFVSPHIQSGGIGRELLRRALPQGARRTYIVATIDLRAQALYHQFGCYQVCAIFTFYKDLHKDSEKPTPSPLNEHSDLRFEPLNANHIEILAQVDHAIHGHRRDADHRWLMAHRQGFLLLRGDRVAGYGYVGDPFSGPFAVLDEADYGEAIAHAEGLALAQGYKSFGLDVPMLNRAAVDYLLVHGYRLSPFFCFYMCDQQPSHVGKTIITAPMIMI